MSTPVFRRSRSSPAVNYGIAVLSAATAVAGAVAFDRLSGTGPAVSLFLCAIMFVAIVVYMRFVMRSTGLRQEAVV